MKQLVIVLIGMGVVLSSCEVHPPLSENEVATLPVVFHIIHKGENPGFGDNLSTSVIYNYFNMLNNNFRNDTGSVDLKIQFKLATKDPDNHMLTEPGIHRIYESSFWYINYNDNNTTPILMQNCWDTKKYINIWVADTYSPMYGLNNINWATFPVMTKDHMVAGLNSIEVFGSEIYYPNYADGIVLSNERILDDPQCRILSHEMGHYLGLLHVFGLTTCDDDYVSDTYHYNRSFYSATGPNILNRYTCDGLWVSGDNYMDYYHQAEYRFTQGQMDRMRYVLSYSPLRSPVRFSQKNFIVPQKDTVGFFPAPIIQICHHP
jgi:zinc-dependent metalloproteinase lipoprotein